MNLLLTWAGSYQKEVLHHTKLNFEMPGQRLTEHRGSTRSWINWWEMKDIPAGMAGHRTDPASHGPGGFLPYSEFLTSRQKSPASSEKQQNCTPHLSVLLRGPGSTNPSCHTPVLSPSPSSSQLWAPVKHRKHQSRAQAHVDGATSSQEGTCYQTPAQLGSAAQARKPQEAFEDESPESIFRFQAQPSCLDI